MDLKSSYPYWAVKNGLMYAIPQLDADLSCDVAVVGASCFPLPGWDVIDWEPKIYALGYRNHCAGHQPDTDVVAGLQDA